MFITNKRNIQVFFIVVRTKKCSYESTKYKIFLKQLVKTKMVKFYPEFDVASMCCYLRF